MIAPYSSRSRLHSRYRKSWLPRGGSEEGGPDTTEEGLMRTPRARSSDLSYPYLVHLPTPYDVSLAVHYGINALLLFCPSIRPSLAGSSGNRLQATSNYTELRHSQRGSSGSRMRHRGAEAAAVGGRRMCCFSGVQRAQAGRKTPMVGRVCCWKERRRHGVTAARRARRVMSTRGRPWEDRT